MFAKTRIATSERAAEDQSPDFRGFRSRKTRDAGYPDAASGAAALGHRFAGIGINPTPGPMIQRQDDDPLDAGLPPNINPFGDTEPAPVDPFGTTDLPPGGAIDPLNPTFPKPPPVPNIPEPPPGGFPNPPPTPASPGAGGGAAEGAGGILETLGSIFGGLIDIFPPVPKWILHPEGSDQEA